MFKNYCLICFFSFFLISGCKSQPKRTSHMKNISAGVAHNLILQQQNNKEFKLIDVRSIEEYESGHIAGSINIDWNKNKEQLLNLNKNDTILLYCRSGRRSLMAMNFLNQNGYLFLFQMEGGINDWNKTFTTLIPSPLNEN